MIHTGRSRIAPTVAIVLCGASCAGCSIERSYIVDTRDPSRVSFADRDGNALLTPGIAQSDLIAGHLVTLERRANDVVAKCDTCEVPESAVLADHQVLVDDLSLPNRPANPSYLGGMSIHAAPDGVEGYRFFHPTRPGQGRTTFTPMRVALPWSDVVSVRQVNHHSAVVGTFFFLVSGAAFGGAALEWHDEVTAPPGSTGASVDVAVAVAFGIAGIVAGAYAGDQMFMPDTETTIARGP